jgi:TolB-like protein/DNA-binding winged helix-turn-helix (wHTH) protein/Flp pilus assembly protein TadD
MPSQHAVYSFGPYELRTQSREIYKNGRKLKLRRQPFQVLLTLVERSGDVVTREELRGRLWPSDTFVDFEHGLNTAITELRGVLNDSASEPQYIETFPKLGYRIVVPVVAVEHAALSAPSETAVTQQEAMVAESLPPQVGRAPVDKTFGLVRNALTQNRWIIPAAIVVILILGLAPYVELSRSRARAQTSNGRAMLAVLPFENLTGDASQEYFSDGLTEEMITQLGQLDPHRLGVIARTSVMHYKHGQQPLQQIGRELGVQYVLEGGVRRDSNNVRISAQLIQMKDQTHLWSRQYNRGTDDLLALQDEIAQEIADEIQITLGASRKKAITDRKPASSPNSYEAYDLYLRGRYFWNKRTTEGFQQAAEYFQEAIAKDPNYAQAYVGLADTFGLMSSWNVVPQNEFMPKARAAALKALQLDESLAEAHTSLALVEEIYDYDWQTAENEFRRAIQLNADYATAHDWYAEYLSWQGRFEEALAESDRARRLDPLSLIIAADHGAILYFSRQYDRSIEQFRSVLAMDPSFSRAHMIYSAYVQQGGFADALGDIQTWRHFGDGPWIWAAEAYVYSRWGRQAQAERALAKLEEFVRHAHGDRTQDLLLAYVGTGRKEEAIALLQKAYSEHSNALVTLKVEPNYDPLRDDPRFQELLRRMGLAEPHYLTGWSSLRPD